MFPSRPPSSRFSLVVVCLCSIVGAIPPAPAQLLPTEVHPSLLFAADDISALQERIQREPYATWWQTVLDRAGSVPVDIGEERTKVRYAKSAAFAYLMTGDETHARQAVDLLLDVQFPPRGGDLGEPHNEGEVVAQYAVAYDMIHNYAAANAAELEELRDILAEEAQRLHKGIVIFEISLGFGKSLKIRLHETPDPRTAGGLHLDNWHVRAYGGLGLAALALADYTGADDTPQEWSDQAFELVTTSLWHQIDDVDGGYAEGPFYSRYAADVYLPYMVALKNLTGVDLFVDPQIEKMHQWSLNLRLPNGRRPNIDDGHLDDWYGHYLSAIYDDGVSRWDWENNVNGLYTRQFSEMDAIAIYDDSVVAEKPSHGPTIFMPEAGDAVFRSDWGEEAVYMLLRAEHGTARAQGLGHEHPDETSFIIYAGGEMLALDAGYINFTNHSKVNRGRNHNVILVDGEGPPNSIVEGESIDGGNDAFLEQTFRSNFIDYAEVRANYSGVDFRRNVMFVDKAYFVMADEVRDEESHTYEWRLHGHGGGDGGGSYERDGSLAQWRQTSAELLAFMPNEEGLEFSERDTIHSFDYLEEPTHTMLRVQQTGADVEFLTMLYPRSMADEAPAFTGVATSGGKAAQMELGALRDLAWVQDGSEESLQLAGPSGVVRSDARFGLIRYDGSRVAGFNVQDATTLSADGEELFSASEAIDVSLELTPVEVDGFVRGPDSGYTIALRLLGPVERITFTGTLVDMALDKHVLTLELAGAGNLNMARDTATAITDDLAALPQDFRLMQNHPNPFNAQTNILFTLGETGHTELTVFNLAGQRLRTLVDGPLPAGDHRVAWDGRDASGQAAASGVYLFRLRFGTEHASQRMLLLK